MTTGTGLYFDGTTSARHSVTIEAAPDAVRIRGELADLGPVVPRGFLTVATTDRSPKVDPAQSGRLELARQIIDPMNHLQLELLSRRRAGDEDESVRLGLHLTVAGIAAGLRNTG